ncbi:hypothetical protein [Brevibacillus sp. SYSU BS000544]|uniref:hypothetical protein n=1 Tax=Brevibacillus sp. SYSU BS000544 TaxID=3416443 RepID=UPI003CE55A36
MDSHIDMIISLIKSVPADKLNDLDTLKTIMVQAGKEAGKNFQESEIDEFIKQLHEFTQDDSSTRMVTMLLQHGVKGVNQDKIEDIKNKLNT